ncbi:DNA polymerase I [Aeromonas hydrophila]|uniref:DNA polymerase I n=1 Tax=Aeromonas hydrophila TaxID=644 RepID=UPI000332AF13|nr:DNA polymerase I [Aeromonas hydrophila]AGM41987.1 DNA polymerase I [Aeromonas hydrophila ML09-119]AHX30724.1 DNA polymerase I [Aeromonas hydrophila subsp. hydrophila AL09-71]AHX67520.1 DNA polymerase I [Aeromonas hydrophila pc104A]AJE38424.1 DNA polymerase I [Aeromonas hydrophila J-1]AKJ36720.1 DNA polymerase I [Aeromonas hydrophila NJ-35]
MAPSNPLILVDGSSYLYRAFFASQQADLRTSTGLPSGAVRVMANMMRSLRKQYPDCHVAVVFDAKGKTFRDDIYPEYKANRASMPDDLRSQVAPIHQMIKAMGFPFLMVEGVEADDVIGTLARQATEKQLPVLISTGDKDMAQLVSDHVTLIDTMKDVKTDREGVIEKFGVPPELIIDYLALMGDKVDNIPGMTGVGEKTALALLQGIGSIDEIAANLDKVAALGFRGSKAFADKFREQEEQVRLSYVLATIKTDVALEQSLEELQLGPIDKEALLAVYREYELRNLIKELESGGAEENEAEGDDEGAAPVAAIETDYRCILDEAEFDEWLARLQVAPLFAFDTETTSLDYMEARVVGVSFAIEPGKAAYVPFGHDYLGAPVQLTEAVVLGKLKPLLEDPARLKVGQNLKYDRNVLLNHGIELQGIAYDTMLESYVLNSTASRHDMDSLARRYLNAETISFEEIAGKGVKQLTFNQIELEQAAPYAAEDADITLRLHQTLWGKLSAEPGLAKVFSEIELPLLPVLARMERLGTTIEPKLLHQQSQEIEVRLAELEKQAHELAGQEFNLSSPKQLGEILFTKLGLPIIKKTPKGAPSTAEEVLAELAETYELPQLLMEHRGLAKLKSTYTDKLPLMIKPQTGRVHTSYHQAVAATGRLSSTDPNLQNIPVRNEQGRRIRQAFIPCAGYKLVAADYSQIELRIMAHLSGDKGLLTAFAEGKDIHKATAAEVFGVALEAVTSDMRRSAKAINFGLIYGMSAFGLAKQLGIGRAEAQKYMDLYFERYPGVLEYMERTRQQADAQGYVETLFGRRLYLPDIKSRNAGLRKAAERAAINAPMQGTAADIIKRAMINVDGWIRGIEDQSIRMLMQVHDELVFEIREEKLEEYIAIIKEKMSAAAELDVPLVVEAGTGDNWDQAH